MSAPVIIPCFNNPTYVVGMMRQLEALGIHNLILIDDNSTFGPMKALLDDAAKTHQVIRLRRSRGPHFFVNSFLFYLKLPRIFCVTDPDLRFNPAMPSNVIELLSACTEKFAIGKVGLALDISERERMRGDKVRHNGNTYHIWEWEAQFWRDQIAATSAGDPIYKADIDTTFAVYNKRYFRRRQFQKALRIAGRFTAQHVPWYVNNGLPESEERFYRATASRHSWWFGHRIES